MGILACLSSYLGLRGEMLPSTLLAVVVVVVAAALAFSCLFCASSFRVVFTSWQPLLPATWHRRCPFLRRLVHLAPRNIRVQASSHRTDGGGGARVHECADKQVDSHLDYLLSHPGFS